MPQANFMTIIYFVAMIALFYFVLIRPQNQKRKEQLAFQNALKKGDNVVTIGGIHGTVVDLTENTVTLKVNEEYRLTFERTAINSYVLSDGTITSSVKKKEEDEGASTKPQDT